MDGWWGCLEEAPGGTAWKHNLPHLLLVWTCTYRQETVDQPWVREEDQGKGERGEWEEHLHFTPTAHSE
jgi:hypothetical protein